MVKARTAAIQFLLRDMRDEYMHSARVVELRFAISSCISSSGNRSYKNLDLAFSSRCKPIREHCFQTFIIVTKQVVS